MSFLSWIDSFKAALVTILIGWSSITYAGGNLYSKNISDPSLPHSRVWDERFFPIKWVVSSAGYPNSDVNLSLDSIIPELQAAFDVWENVETSNVYFEYGGLIDRRQAADDGFNLITFADDTYEFPPGAVGLAVTYTFLDEVNITAENADLDGDGTADIPEGTYAPGTIYDGNVLFKSSLEYSITGDAGTHDIRDIAIHEIGHMLGLSHSSLEDSVMYPFARLDPTLTRTISEDDRAYISYFYPDTAQYEAIFGKIEGSVLHGRLNKPIVGAHVYALNPETGKKVGGAYTNIAGQYELPIKDGIYYLGIEPLDGDPPALDPKRINFLIENTQDVFFIEELFDANESGIEADPLAAEAITVAAGLAISDIDFYTNESSLPGVVRNFSPGINYFSYPVEVMAGLTAFEFLKALGDGDEFNAIDRLNSETGLYERASYLNGQVVGVDFPIHRGVGYLVHARDYKAVKFAGSPSCPAINLRKGLNSIGVPCPSAGFSAFDLMTALGGASSVASIKRYSKELQDYESAYFDGLSLQGVDFELINGEAYFVDMNVDKAAVDLTSSSTLFAPTLTGISPGRAPTGEIIAILGKGFSKELDENKVVFNGVPALVLFAADEYLSVVVPDFATSGPVSVTVSNKTSNTVDFIVDPEALTEEQMSGEYLIPGVKVTGQVDSDQERDRYDFIAREGDLVTISAIADTLGQPDLALFIEAEGGVVIAANDDSRLGQDPLINRFRITRTAVYTVVVAPVAGTGMGHYTLDIDILSRSTEPAINILRGGAQSAVSGADLPAPFEIYVSGPTGKPLAGVPVTFTANNVSLGANNPSALTLFNAGSTVVVTNGNGIATIQATAPNAENSLYDVVVSVPGMAPATIAVSTINEPIARVVVSKQFFNCKDEGCPVGEVLDEPYEIEFQSEVGNPIPNVLTQWAVVAGGGELANYISAETIPNSGQQLSNIEGISQVFHQLGKKVYFDGDVADRPVKQTQAVIALIPGYSEPIIFTAESRAGDPKNIETLNSTFTRITVNTIAGNLLRVYVTDQYGNPVEDAEISVESGDVKVTPGVIDAVRLDDYKTNEKGIWIGSIRGSITPTIDEFGSNETPGLADRYSINLLISSGASVKYEVDVDMGPSVIGEGGIISTYVTDFTAGLNGGPGIGVQVIRYQRRDSNNNSDWTDDVFSLSNLDDYFIEGHPIEFYVSRQDGRDASDYNGKYQFPLVNGQDRVTLITDEFGIAATDIVEWGDIAGDYYLTHHISEPITVQFKQDNGNLIGDPTVFPLEPYELGGVPVYVFPVVVEAAISAGELSNIDWESLVIQINDTHTIFSGSGQGTELNTFPHYTAIYIDNVQLTEWPSQEFLQAGGFSELRIVHEPTGDQISTGINSLSIQADTTDPEAGDSFSKRQTFDFDPDTPTSDEYGLWSLELDLDGGEGTITARKDFSRTYFAYDTKNIGSYQVYSTEVEHESSVRVELLNSNQEAIKTLIPSNTVSPGLYSFVVLRSDLEDVQATAGDSDFYIRIVKVPENSANATINELYAGNLITNISSEMLGQVIEHDTLIQRGSLTFSRQDIALKGVGPQLNFIRRYSNAARVDRSYTDLGYGWSHNHNLSLTVVAKTDGLPSYGNNLPGWIAGTRTSSPSTPIKWMTAQELNAIQTPAGIPSIVSVTNGGTFEWDTVNNVWVPQRGFHGSLTSEDILQGNTIIGQQWVYTSKDGTRYTFETSLENSSGQYDRYLISRIEDKNGNALTYEYQTVLPGETERRIDKVIDQTGRYLDFSYKEQARGHNRLTNITLYTPSGTSSSEGTATDLSVDFHYFTIDEAVTFDMAGMLKSFERDTFNETYGYSQEQGDKLPNIALITDANQRKTYYRYHNAASIEADASAFDKLNFYIPGVDITDLVHKICYPTDVDNSTCESEYAEITYDVALGNTRTVKNIRGHTTRYVLNNLGNPTRIEAPEGKTTELKWSVDLGEPDNLLREKHELATGEKWQYFYDAKGNLTREIDPYQNETIQQWNQEFSVLTYRKDRNSHEFEQILDDNGNVTEERRDAYVGESRTKTTIVTEHSYDNFVGEDNLSNGKGLRSSTTVINDVKNQKTQFGYDVYGNLTTVLRPEGSRERTICDERGRPEEVFDANNNKTTYNYDNLDRIGRITDAASNTTEIEYDAKGNKDWEEFIDTYVVDGTAYQRRLKLDYTFDARDRVKDIARTGEVKANDIELPDSAVSGVKVFGYDGNSNITSETDWKGNATTYTYDGLERKLVTTNRDNKTMSYGYKFVNTGLKKTITDYEGLITTENYDWLQRLTTVNHPTVNHIDGTVSNYQKVYSYDNLNNITAILDEEGNTTTYKYDPRYLKIEQINALDDTYLMHYDAAGNQIGTQDEEGRITTYEYDLQNRLIFKNTEENQQWGYTYHPNDLLKIQTNPWGFTHEFEYDELNQREKTIHPDLTETIERYTKDGEQVFVQDAEGRSRKTIAGLEGRVLQESDPRQRLTTHRYDANNNRTHSTLTWPNAPAGYTGPSSIVNHFKYDALDRLAFEFEAYQTPIERITKYTYDNQGHILQELQPDGRFIEYEYDELYRAKKITTPPTTTFSVVDASSHPKTETWQQFDGVGNKVSTTDRRGNSSSTFYDKLYRPITLIDALNQQIDNVYDKVGNLRKQINKRGYGTETVYDGLNRVSEQFALEQVTSRARAANDDIDQNIVTTRAFILEKNEYDIDLGTAGIHKNAVTDANNNTVITTLDWRGNPTEIQLPASADNSSGAASDESNYEAATLINQYDDSGWLTTETDAQNFSTTYTHFADGTVQSRTNAENETTQYEYDVFGNQALVIKPKLNKQQARYDARNRLVEVQDDQGHQTRYQYDLNSNLINQYMPAANDDGDQERVEYTYDALNRKRSHIQHKASGNLVSLYDYDAEGNITRTTDAKQQIFTQVYDVLNRLTTRNYPANDDIISIVNIYDENNNLDVVTETKPNSVVEVTDHQYDLLDRLTERKQRGHLVSYTYDNNGNRTSVTGTGGSTTYTFDTRNRLATAIANGRTTRYRYLQNGWTDRVTQGNGATSQTTYDDIGRIDVVTHKEKDGTVLSLFDYTYDDNGNRTQQIETQNGFSTAATTVTTDYVYDSLDRLESFTQTEDSQIVESHSYTYYPSYDRKTETVTEGTTTVSARTFTYDETFWVKDITEAAAGATDTIAYAYDNNGNTTQKTDGTGKGPASTVFTYNKRNQLIDFASGDAGTETSKGRYDYNYAGMRIRHLGSDRGDIEYIYDDQSILDERSITAGISSTQLAHYRYGDRLLSLENGSNEQFYHFASLGTTANLTDAQGQNTMAYRVDPFGDITEQEGTSLNRQVFTGHEHDSETGLIYMKARFYDPDVGRFLNQDTYLGEQGTPPSLHRYLYAYSNPTYYFDPNGHAPLGTEDVIMHMEMNMMGFDPSSRQGLDNYDQLKKGQREGILETLKENVVGTVEFAYNMVTSPVDTSIQAYEGTKAMIANPLGGLEQSMQEFSKAYDGGDFWAAGRVQGKTATNTVSAIGGFAGMSKLAKDVVRKGVQYAKKKSSLSETLEQSNLERSHEQSNSDVPNSVTAPSKLYDVDAWMSFYDANPNYRRSIGAAGINKPYHLGEATGPTKHIDKTPEIPDYIYRGDSRNMQAIIDDDGFNALGDSMDLYAHAKDSNAPLSGIVGATKSYDQALTFASGKSRKVYVIKPTNDAIDVNSELDFMSPHAHELEVAHPFGIPLQNVRGVTLHDKGYSVLNPNYYPK